MKNKLSAILCSLVLSALFVQCTTLSSGNDNSKQFSNSLNEVTNKIELSLIGLDMFIAEMNELDGGGYHIVARNQTSRNQAGNIISSQLTVLHIYVQTLHDQTVEVRTQMPMTDHYGSQRTEVARRFFTNLSRQGLQEAELNKSFPGRFIYIT